MSISLLSSIWLYLFMRYSNYNVTAMDVSADLTELGRTPVTVVSAGIKSILDIGRTLEYLVSVVASLISVRSLMFLHRVFFLHFV